MSLVEGTTSNHFLATSLVYVLLLGPPVFGQQAAGDRPRTVVSLLPHPLRLANVEVGQPRDTERRLAPASNAHRVRAPPVFPVGEFTCVEV
jgi:hypothetical protein